MLLDLVVRRKSVLDCILDSDSKRWFTTFVLLWEKVPESDARSVHWTLSCEMKHQNGSLILMQNISGGDTVALRIVPPLSAFWDLGPRQYASQWRLDIK